MKNWLLRLARLKPLRDEADSRKQYEVVFSVLRNASNIEEGYLAPGAYLDGAGRMAPTLSQFDYEVKYLLGETLGAMRREPGARTLLEVGCGAGLNCMAAALALPGLERIVGLDQASSALQTARELLKNPPRRLLAPYGRPDPAALAARIEYVQGSASSIPFSDKSFDVVFTKLALEQMGTFWDKAVSEIRRVARSLVVVCEMLYDMQRDAWERLHILGNGYPRQTLARFEGRGFEVLEARRLTEIHKIKNTPCLVVLRPKP